jgi:hypothetical protein
MMVTGLFRTCWLPLSICGGEFEASRSVAGAFHFVLQFVEQPAEFGRVLFGSSKFDRPILRVAEVGVQEAVQFDGRALEPGGAPCESPPGHSIVFLFHRLVLSNSCRANAVVRDTSIHPLHAAVEWC